MTGLPSATAGWKVPGACLAVDAILRLSASGIETFEVTAIDRDGLLEGPDIALLRALVGLGLGRIVASGGISSIDDVLAVQAAGCGGAIVGRAIYEGQIDLAGLVRVLRDANR